jgi:uncharacterized protein with von Willebrand factor type A (vWA) domain
MKIYRYYKGTSIPPSPFLDLDSIFHHLAHPFLENLDVESALTSLKREGIHSHEGEPLLLGIEDMIEQLKDLREQLQSSFSLDTAIEQFQEMIEKILPDQSLDTVQELIDKLTQELKRFHRDTPDPDGMRKGLMERKNKIFAFGRMVQKYQFTGKKRLSLENAIELAEEFELIDKVERDLKKVTWGFHPQTVDVSELKRLLGDTATDSWLMINRLNTSLEDEGYIEQKGNHYHLTSKGLKKMGREILDDLFSALKKDGWGMHATRFSGDGITMNGETKPYQFGDQFSLDINQTLMNSLRKRGGGIPVKVSPEDFEVYQTEYSTPSSTALLLDMSKSMRHDNNFVSAKMVALALESLIRMKYPRDNLTIIGFSSWARLLSIEELPSLQWDNENPYTNMEEGFSLAEKYLSKQKGRNKQIVLISDGEPTAHRENDLLFFQFPPHPRTLQKTLLMAKHCATKGITINTFMLGRRKTTVEFINQLTQVNRGRIFFTNSDNLGKYVLVDYLTQRGKRPFQTSCPAGA